MVDFSEMISSCYDIGNHYCTIIIEYTKKRLSGFKLPYASNLAESIGTDDLARSLGQKPENNLCCMHCQDVCRLFVSSEGRKGPAHQD